jgi:23S rRNA pseudouridine2605 synthase
MTRASNNTTKSRLKTLERVFSKAGVGSRTEARSWIGAGRVRVNGKVIRNPDHWVDLAKDRVALDGKLLRKVENVYILLYKPKGFLTTHHDPQGRPTVYDLLEDVATWVTSVGRLDLDTTGLLLLTNDTAFANAVMSPESKVPKTYQLKSASRLSGEQIEQLRSGVALSDGPAHAEAVRVIRETSKYTHLEMVLNEGRNRQVRRMIEAVGGKVLKLVRTAIGPIRIENLPSGKWRHLSPEEVRALVGRARKLKGLRTSRIPVPPNSPPDADPCT